LVDNIGGQFRRGVFQCNLDGFDDRSDRFGQGFGDLTLRDHDFFRNAVHQVAAFDFHAFAFAVFRRAGRADFLLDVLGAGFTDQQVMHAADIGNNGVVHLVAADAHGTRIDDAAQRNHGDFGRAAADIDDHRTGGFGDGQSGADRGSHGFFNQFDTARAGAFGGFNNGTALDGGGA